MQNGSAPFDDINSYRVPSWTTLDLGARYVFGRERPLAIRAQVANVSDSRFWISGFSGRTGSRWPTYGKSHDLEDVLNHHLLDSG